jgi:hypothetical protein
METGFTFAFLSFLNKVTQFHRIQYGRLKISNMVSP